MTWGNNAKFESVDAENISSRSLAVWRVYKDGTEIVATDDSETEIARGTSPTTIWQSALDKAYSEFDAAEPYEPVAVIDGGGLGYSLGSEITVKDGAVVKNARFYGGSVSDPQVLTVGGPDDGSSHNAIGVSNVVVRDGQNRNIHFRDISHCHIGRVVSENAGSDGIIINSCIGNQFNKLCSRNSGGIGIDLNDGGSTAFKPNANTFVTPRTQSNSGTGWRFSSLASGADGNLILGIVSESNGTHGVSDSHEENTYISPWVEGNTNRGILLVGGARQTIITPTMFNNDGGGGGNQGIRIDGADEAVIKGPIGGNDVIQPANGVGNRFENVPKSKMGIDNATRTRHNRMGAESANAETPTASNWNVGDEVDFTDTGDGSGNGVYVLLKDGTWSQIGT